MDLGLQGRVALVLGATSGLGRATAEALAAEGARVAVVGRRETLVRELADRLGGHGIVADVTDPTTPQRLVEETEAALGPVEVVVLNGGGPPPGTADDFTEERSRAAVDLLLHPHVALVERVLPGMRAAGWGRVLAIASAGVQQPIPTLTSSNVGRAALAAYLKTLAGAVAADGVTVNVVLPGRIDTDRVASLDQAAAERSGRSVEETRTGSERSIPAGRYGTAAELGAVVTFLASTRAAYVTGEQVRVDGGLVAGY